MKLVYVGKKPQFPVCFPVGATSKGAIRKTVMLAPGEEIEVTEEEAKKLIESHTHKNEKGEIVVQHFAVKGEEPQVKTVESVEGEAPKKRGRKKKKVEESVEEVPGEDESEA
jgi:hypothetical protein